MNTIYFGPSKNEDLQDLTRATCGQEQSTELENMLQLIESFKAISESPSGDINKKMFEVKIFLFLLDLCCVYLASSFLTVCI